MNNNDMSKHDLIVDGVSKSFTLGDVCSEVLRGVSFTMSPGQSMAIVGPSGSGKSTLMHIIGGLDVGDAGSVRLGDEEVTKLSGKSLAKFRNQHVGFIFQDHHLLPQLSVLDNVLVPVMAFASVRDEDVSRAVEILESVGLQDRMRHRPGQLSGGQRERVAIARALIMRPSLILADEPTGNLDRRTGEQVTELLTSLPHQHDAILIAVTHADSVAAAMDRQMELIDGVLC